MELTVGGRSLAETKIQRGIFQGDAISPLLFIIAMMPLNQILRKCTARHKARKRKYTPIYSKLHLKISNWKTPGHDGIHGFWFKKFTFIEDRLALEMNICLETAHVREWMTIGRITLIQKDPNKGNAPNNYRPITCLPMLWKILTTQKKGRDLLLAN